jgi:hypothetical protein
MVTPHPTPSTQALTKVTVGQLTLFPVYTTTLFMYLGVLEGKSWQQSWQRLKERFPETFTTGEECLLGGRHRW